MKIDIIKGNRLFSALSKYNSKILEACEGFYFTSENYNINKNQASFWFDPRCVRDLALSHIYPKCSHIQKNPNLSLILYAPNYFSLLLINALYEDTNILIEDQACGMARLDFYLNRLGFNNFNFIDNFTQMPRTLFDSMMQKFEAEYKVNDWSCIPKIVNLVGYTHFVKPVLPETELVLIYNKLRLIIEKDGNYLYECQDLDYHKPLENKVLLAECKYDLAKAYCNKDKYEEFKEKLKKYKD